MRQMEEGFLCVPKFCAMSGLGGACDDLLTRGFDGSFGFLAFSGLWQSAIENCFFPFPFPYFFSFFPLLFLPFFPTFFFPLFFPLFHSLFPVFLFLHLLVLSSLGCSLFLLFFFCVINIWVEKHSPQTRIVAKKIG